MCLLYNVLYAIHYSRTIYNVIRLVITFIMMMVRAQQEEGQ